MTESSGRSHVSIALLNICLCKVYKILGTNVMCVHSISVEAMRKVDIIRTRRTNLYVMNRLRKGRDVEIQQDIREVKRDISLIKSPAAGLRERLAAEEAADDVEEKVESDVDMRVESNEELEETVDLAEQSSQVEAV